MPSANLLVPVCVQVIPPRGLVPVNGQYFRAACTAELVPDEGSEALRDAKGPADGLNLSRGLVSNQPRPNLTNLTAGLLDSRKAAVPWGAVTHKLDVAHHVRRTSVGHIDARR